MKPLSTAAEWPPIAVYDIEADDWVDVTLICHVDELDNRLDFPDVPSYLDFLFDKWEGYEIWAHSGGRYDHRFLIHEALQRGWDFKAAMSGGNIVVLTIDNGKKKIVFADSFRLMPDSAKNIGKSVGLAKLDVDRSNLKALTRKQVIEYCYRDCDIILKGLQGMRDTLTASGADFAYTLASVATRWVRRSPVIDWSRLGKWRGGKFEPNANTTLWDNFSYGAYFGGRCEMFKRGHFELPIYYYDIVSSYPRSMQEELPLYFKGFYAPPKNLKNVETYLSHPGITECRVHVPRAKVTPLCVKAPNGRLVFPHGTLFGQWTNIELLEALKHGATIEHITMQARFESKAFLRPFVDTFYSLRKQAKADKDVFKTFAYKILLNSLYGKLVETVDRKSYLTRNEFREAEERGAKIEATPTHGVWAAISQEEGPFRHTAAGAYVTAYSRLRLYRGLTAAIAHGGEVYYCDTDSIMTDRPLEGVSLGSNLGDWNHEHTFSEVELVLPKVYRALTLEAEPIYRCKGCPIQRERDTPEESRLRWDLFKRYAQSNEEIGAAERAILERDGITGFVSDINAGRTFPKVSPVLRVLRSEDKKRTWEGPDSWPLEWSEIA